MDTTNAVDGTKESEASTPSSPREEPSRGDSATMLEGDSTTSHRGVINHDLADHRNEARESGVELAQNQHPIEEAAPILNGDISKPPSPVGDESTRLRLLGATGRDQEDIEKDVGREADRLLLEQAEERDNKRLEKTLVQRRKLAAQIQDLERRMRDPSRISSAAAARMEAEIPQLKEQLGSLDRDRQQIEERIGQRKRESAETKDHGPQSETGRRPGESRRDYLIRTGKITPFSNVGLDVQKTSESLAEVMMDAEELSDIGSDEEEDATGRAPAKPLSHRNLVKPGYTDAHSSETDSATEFREDRPRKKRKTSVRWSSDSTATFAAGAKLQGDEDKYGAELEGTTATEGEEDEYMDNDLEAVVHEATKDRARKPRSARTSRTLSAEGGSSDDEVEDLADLDDGDEHIYLARLRKWTKGRKTARRRAVEKRAKRPTDPDADGGKGSESGSEIPEDREEWLMPHPSRADTVLDGGLSIPGDIYPSLFDYQKTGVQWLSELYTQQVGGIVGDEMGLGKTIQAIAFLAGLHHSGRLEKPVIIVTPATVMKQWVNEFHQWWPPLRVSILHTSGSGMMDVRSESAMEDRLEAGYAGSGLSGSSSKSAERIVSRVLREGHVLVTTYSGLQTYADLLLPVNWGYAVLDEGHKIRNPNAKITIYCKSLRTPNRIILSGTPMQNNLTELWSLFDFIFPLRLGTLVSFRTQFEIPIKQGGYANASNLQVETALKCAETLKDAISPYLLQRFKIDVAADLPKKSEQVLFCRLTKVQRQAYEAFLASSDMTAILEGKRQSLFGIDILRKICNHPDLQDHRTLSIKAGYNYGNGAKSGKMQVVKSLLELWRDTGHKTLLFAQHRIMLDILEKFLRASNGFKFLRMDGTTAIKERQNMVDRFNNDPDVHVFLLTTKVGGLGVNLTGADRVIIYDPDWNPSTDMQARERSWRLGQKREVMIYRLMTAGTIEEKIYHRQIFKQFLTNKILRDPKQRQTFQLKDLHDLFSLGSAEDENTETGGLFKGSEVRFEKEPDPTRTSAEVPTSATADDSIPPQPNEGGADAIQKAHLGTIPGISHRESFHTGETLSTSNGQPSAPDSDASSSAKPVQQDLPTNNDSRILSSIFSRSGVHSALEHDSIIAGSSRSKVVADPAIIAAEARKVAAAAARELKRASEQAAMTPIGTPTWTGTMGSAGRPNERYSSPAPSARGRGGLRGGRGAGRGGPSSASVLASLAARQQTLGRNSRDSTPGSGEEVRGKEFLMLIRDYLLAHGGSAYTQMLIDHFNRFCRTPERTAEFKEMLKAIASLEKSPAAGSHTIRGRNAGIRSGGSGGRGKWVLKKEFGGSG